MTTARSAKGLLWLVLNVLVVFTGLCTIFALVVTVAQAWQEHAETQWPEATARVDDCGLQRTSTNGGHRMYIRCRLSYAVGSERNAANVYSSQVPAPEVWQYPPNRVAPLEEWLDQHPTGTPIVVRYDPDNPAKVVLVSTYLPPLEGPRTPNNVKLLAFFAGSFLVLLIISRFTRPRAPWRVEGSSAPISA